MNDRLFIQGYVVNDYITPLDEFIANDELNQYWDETDFVPTYLKAVQYNGKTYGFPVYGESTFLMYRKDLFQEYGIKVPTTMDELAAAARTIKEKSNGSVAGITLRGQQGIHAVYTWGAFLWGYGGRYFDESGRLVVDSPEAIRGTQMYVDLLNKYGPVGYANFGWQENRLLFQQGKAGMTIDATVNGAYCEDPKESDIVGKVGYAPVPTEVTNGYGGTASLAVHGFYINNAISQKQKEAAFLFGSWATSAVVQEKTIAVEAHSGLTSITAMQSVAFKEKYGAFSDGMISALNAANADYLPTVPEANEIINKIGTALSQVLAGSRNTDQALKAVCEDVNTNVLKK
jgi:ABC-type glycerol-3-phosphate transport system substrate-binding protein